MPPLPCQRNSGERYRAELDDVLVGYLKRLVPFLLFVFIFVEGVGFWIWPTWVASDLLISDTVAILALAILLILLFRGRIRGRAAHVALVLVALVALQKNALAIFWLQDPLLTFNTMLILLITAIVSVVWLTYLIVWICVVTCWIFVAGPVAPLPENLAIWSAFNISGFLGALILNFRLAHFRREFEARYRQEEQSNRLAEALHYDRSLNRLALSTRGTLETRPLIEGIVCETRKMLAADRGWMLSLSDLESDSVRIIEAAKTRDEASPKEMQIPLTDDIRKQLQEIAGSLEVQILSHARPVLPSQGNGDSSAVTTLASRIGSALGSGWMIGLEFRDTEHQVSPMAMAAFERICVYGSSALNSAMLHGHLNEMENRLRHVFTHLEEGIYELDVNGRITMLSPSIERFLGLPQDELLGNQLYHHLDSDALEKLITAFDKVRESGRSERGIVVALQDTEGKTRRLQFSLSAVRDNSGSVKNFLGIIRDVTEEQEQHERQTALEEQLRQSQQLETLGRLAGGVAHDFNNLLSGIMGQAQLIAMRTQPGDPNRGAAEIVERAAERGAQLTAQLLGFARQGRIQNEVIDLRHSAEEIARLLERTIDKSIRIHLECEESPCCIEGDPGQIHGVLLNLSINARDAMPEGGSLTLRVRILQPDEAPEWTREIPPSNRLVCVEVQDSGTGIPEEIRDKVFEPFFTTKSQGKGSGMGLAMAHGTVLNHGGEITFECPAEGGTLFRVFLPCREGDVKELRPSDEPSKRSPGGERVLVIDDEEAVRNLMGQMLEMMGYEVLNASSGEEGVEIYRENAERIDLVIVDMIMTGISGLQCFEQLKAIRPDVRAILCSGYSRESRAREMLDAGVAGFIQKPFKYKNLEETIGGILDPAG